MSYYHGQSLFEQCSLVIYRSVTFAGVAQLGSHASRDGLPMGGEALSIDVYQTHTEQQLNEICRDLCKPVVSIRVTAAAALADPGLETQVRRRLEQIAGQADWLASIIN